MSKILPPTAKPIITPQPPDLAGAGPGGVGVGAGGFGGATGNGYGFGMTIGFGMHPPLLVAVSAVHTVISASPVPLTLNGVGKAMALK